jgi:hypothetical protein
MGGDRSSTDTAEHGVDRHSLQIGQKHALVPVCSASQIHLHIPLFSGWDESLWSQLMGWHWTKGTRPMSTAIRQQSMTESMDNMNDVEDDAERHQGDALARACLVSWSGGE